jgi:hypothetical protein
MQNCHKCGEPTAACHFEYSATICNFCWRDLDLGRYEEIPPTKGSIPQAPVIKLSTPGKLGIKCPHCSYNIERFEGYFSADNQLERCPRCMEHYKVRKGDAK